MFNHKLNETATFKTHADWFLLAFLAGNINTGGFLSAGRFVSHVTGFATLTGISFEKGNWLEAVGLLTIPCYFLVGVMVSGYLTEKQKSGEIHGQKYAPVLTTVALLLLLAAIGGTANFFGGFGIASNFSHDYILLALLCGACGLQNAAITSASGSTVRTTHLTGLTTDLGLGLIRAEVHYSTPSVRAIDRKANLLRFGTILAFFLGSLIGAYFYARFQYLGFLLPMCLALYAAFSASRS
jgi:uncharacterized membrane protein YoaK (UPF0700 family)